MTARRRSLTEAGGDGYPATRPPLIFTHLFSAPLTELEMAKGGGRCQVPKPVPELSYEGERETLVSTLRESYRAIRFRSEAANTASFSRAVGCPDTPGRGTADYGDSSFRGASSTYLARTGSDPSGGRSGRRCSGRRAGSGSRGGECRILHFTGHGQPGKLTFEDKHGQLQYVDETQLLAMLQGQSFSARGSSGSDYYNAGGAAARPGRERCAGTATNCTSGRGSKLASGKTAATIAAPHVNEEGPSVGIGYAPFEDVSGGIAELGFEGQVAEELERVHDEPTVSTMPTTAATSRGENCSSSGLQLVFLSSCHSASLAHVFIQAGVRHVIAVKEKDKILDHKAQTFAHTFYKVLIRGDTVQQAFDIAMDQLAVSLDRPLENRKFVLLPTKEDGGNHDIPIEEVHMGSFEILTSPQPLYPCDKVTEHFRGRAVEVQEVVRHMVDKRRCITIVGHQGIGKTQVLLKACAYTQERHVFGDIFFCRVDKDVDACRWLEKGFALPQGSLGARNIDGAMVVIADLVRRRQRQHQKSRGSLAPHRSLLVLDHCERYLLVGQERMKLGVLLERLFAALPDLAAAITMRCGSTDPARAGVVGVRGEKVVVVEGLNDKSTAELLVKCCPRKLDHIEIDPNRPMPPTDLAESLDAFSRSDIIRALRGHPGCVVDFSKLVGEAERSLFLERERWVDVEIPKILSNYGYHPNQQSTPTPGRPIYLVETMEDYFDRVIRKASVGPGLYRAQQPLTTLTWGELCEALEECFARRVPGASSRPLSSEDLTVFAEDEGLWGSGSMPPAMRRGEYGGDVSAVVVTLDSFKPFWKWFWQATATLRRTGAWEERNGMRGFAGFLKKVTANRVIARADPGTFLIRFSTSKLGAMAIHYKSHKAGVINVLVTVDSDGQLSVDGKKHRDLSALVMSTRNIRRLYPKNTRKELVFAPRQNGGYPQPRSSGSSGDAGGGRGEPRRGEEGAPNGGRGLGGERREAAVNGGALGGGGGRSRTEPWGPRGARRNYGAPPPAVTAVGMVSSHRQSLAYYA